ncbi:DUF4073 domain-containing protein [Paenibacillus wenxiniae]|uniref:DUF4073 domain-containing protein n=1 Tax=Paenibacillus wenxiniae TaxID=1636843 RepID=A0ABW4RMU5_9BACL
MRQESKWRNRIAAMSLVILLMVGMIPPQQAYARGDAAMNVTKAMSYGNLQSALDAATSGDTIRLLDNVSADTYLNYNVPNRTVTLDLYGYNVVRSAGNDMANDGDGSAIQIAAGTMTIQDTSPTANGSVQVSNNYGSSGSAVSIGATGTLNLNSGSLIGPAQGVLAYQNGATVNIKGGLVFANANTTADAAISATASVYGTISGGYIGMKNSSASVISSTYAIGGLSKLSVEGGYFTGNSYYTVTGNTYASLSGLSTTGTIVKLSQPVTQPLSGSTQFLYHLVKSEATPAAALDPVNETLTGLKANAGYSVNGATYVVADTYGTIPLSVNWIGSTIGIVKKGITDTSADSASQLLDIPARPSAPAVTADDTNDVIIGIKSSMQYSIDGGSWTTYSSTNPPQLSGDHTVKVRYAATVSPAALTSEVAKLSFTAATPTPTPTTGYKVSGNVIEGNAEAFSAVTGANVQLYQGTTAVSKAVVTDTYGNFAITGVNNGTYSLIVTKADRTGTYVVRVNNSNYSFANNSIFLPAASLKSEVKISGNNTPNIVVGGLTDLFLDTKYSFTADDQQLVNSGGKVSITMSVQQESATTAPGAAALQKLATGKTIRMYLDLTLNKVRTTASNVSTTSTLPVVGKLLQVVVPYDSKSQKNVSIYRYHQGVAQSMSSLPYSTTAPSSEGFMVTPDQQQVIIFSQNFSTYAIASDSSTTPTVISGGGGGGFTSGAAYPITVIPSAGGTISPSSLLSVPQGSNQTFTFTPDKGYVIKDVLIDGKSVGAVSSYTFKNVVAAHTVKVVFVATTGMTTPTDTNVSTGEGLPYYMNGNQKVYIGFAATINGQMKYIAPAGKEVRFQPNAYSFSDMNGSWATAPVSFVTDREIFLGTGDGKFAPNQGMTRAMFAAAIGRLYERSYGTLKLSGASPFKDVSSNSWYGTYVNWAAQNGIIQGMSSTAFEPNRNITREEMAALLYRFASFMKVNNTINTDQTLTFTDAGSIGAWAKPAVQFFSQKNIINGRSKTQFAPKQTATRAEAAAVLEGFIKLVVTQAAK